ncbi:uncharacterized protein LOC116162629 isoform X2 [Photinus pyralis]|uniref:uncharacterized protein LOC116162629 isoform X2 n=1 Tax=Photinus pyralis TaxID=7054 RepID=UPI001266FF2C|nr:uncharacterized protein LOC116162629 isoform X2 [Photinus pyralis]
MERVETVDCCICGDLVICVKNLKIYHMCDGIGRQFSYACPNATLFQQRMLICDHWYMVNCNKSEVDYDANLLIGQRDKPFVRDSDNHRTPRPNLLSQKAPEYGSLFRNGKTNLNLVGIETDNLNDSMTFKKHYSLPTHWFTKLSNEGVPSTTQTALKYNPKVKRPQHKEVVPKKSVAIASKRQKPTVAASSNRNQFSDLQPNVNNKGELQNTVKIENATTDDHWNNLKKLFSIPDYDFPLDAAKRPGYESGPSSFDAS